MIIANSVPVKRANIKVNISYKCLASINHLVEKINARSMIEFACLSTFATTSLEETTDEKLKKIWKYIYILLIHSDTVN